MLNLPPKMTNYTVSVSDTCKKNRHSNKQNTSRECNVYPTIFCMICVAILVFVVSMLGVKVNERTL